MRVFVSHLIRKGDPGWPGNPTVELNQYTSLENGDTANTYSFTLFNHFGTHFDAPRHYHAAGLTINEIPKEHFFYQHPLLLDIPKGRLEKIEVSDLQPYEDSLKVCDLLMLRTGFEAQRSEDPAAYSQQGPAVSAACAAYLADRFCGTLKAVAVDFLSLACPADTTDGDEAHRQLLGNYRDGYICIIEDVHMAGLPSGFLKEAAAIPLFLDGLDSAPVTMWVEV